MKSAKRNYSPTEREALALRDGLVKFQPYIEGEKILAVTDHTALVWSRTFQNVNRRLLTCGTVFAAYPDLQIIHRAGRVHSNVDPISRLQWRVPLQEGPNSDQSAHTTLNSEQESLTNFFELAPKFEARTLGLVAQFEEEGEEPEIRVMYSAINSETHPEGDLSFPFQTAKSHSLLLMEIHPLEIQKFVSSYDSDPYFSRVRTKLHQEQSWKNLQQPLFSEREDGMLMFKDWNGNLRLCVPKDQRAEILSETHDEPTRVAPQDLQ